MPKRTRKEICPDVRIHVIDFLKSSGCNVHNDDKIVHVLESAEIMRDKAIYSSSGEYIESERVVKVGGRDIVYRRHRVHDDVNRSSIQFMESILK